MVSNFLLGCHDDQQLQSTPLISGILKSRKSSNNYGTLPVLRHSTEVNPTALYSTLQTRNEKSIKSNIERQSLVAPENPQKGNFLYLLEITFLYESSLSHRNQEIKTM